MLLALFCRCRFVMSINIAAWSKSTRPEPCGGGKSLCWRGGPDHEGIAGRMFFLWTVAPRKGNRFTHGNPLLAFHALAYKHADVAPSSYSMCRLFREKQLRSTIWAISHLSRQESSLGFYLLENRKTQTMNSATNLNGKLESSAER